MRSIVTRDPWLRVVWRELIDALWEHGGVLDGNVSRLSDDLGVPPAEVNRCLQILGPEDLGFLDATDGRLSNERVSRELENELAYRESQREKGKRGGLRSVESKAAAKQMLDETQAAASENPSSGSGNGKHRSSDPQAGFNQVSSPPPPPPPPAPQGSTAAPSSDAPAVPSGFRFPVTGKGPPEWEAPQELLRSTEEAFPAVDVPAEWRKALLWLISNPGNRKTPIGMAKFLSGWVTRAVNRGDFVRRNGARPSPTEPDPEVARRARADRAAAEVRAQFTASKGGA